MNDILEKKRRDFKNTLKGGDCSIFGHIDGTGAEEFLDLYVQSYCLDSCDSNDLFALYKCLNYYNDSIKRKWNNIFSRELLTGLEVETTLDSTSIRKAYVKSNFIFKIKHSMFDTSNFEVIFAFSQNDECKGELKCRDYNPENTLFLIKKAGIVIKYKGDIILRSLMLDLPILIKLEDIHNGAKFSWKCMFNVSSYVDSMFDNLVSCLNAQVQTINRGIYVKYDFPEKDDDSRTTKIDKVTNLGYFSTSPISSGYGVEGEDNMHISFARDFIRFIRVTLKMKACK